MINDKLAFRIMKKARTKQVYKDGDFYYVSDGCFVFRTMNTSSLIELGLIDFKGYPKENFETIPKIITDALFLDTVKKTTWLLDAGTKQIRILKCGKTLIGVDNKYYEIFSDCDLRNAASSTKAVYAYEKDEIVGLIIPVRTEASQLSDQIKQLYEAI